MSTASATGPAAATIALIGNPNTGKSTLFSALAGIAQKVGNYPGVTVEKKLGTLRHEGRTLTLVDLPGTYSLAPQVPRRDGRRRCPHRPEQRDVGSARRGPLRGRRQQPRAQPLHRQPGPGDGPADGRGAQHGRRGPGPGDREIDAEILSREVGCASRAEVQANRKVGLDDADRSRAIGAVLGEPAGEVRPSPFPPALSSRVRSIGWIADALSEYGTAAPPLATWSPGCCSTRPATSRKGSCPTPPTRPPRGPASRRATRLALKAGWPVPAVEAMARYAWVVHDVLDGVGPRGPGSRPDHGVGPARRGCSRIGSGGRSIFAGLMLADVPGDVLAGPSPGDRVPSTRGSWPASATSDRRHDAADPGPAPQPGRRRRDRRRRVGVMAFVPQIFVPVSLFIAVLEDCGYMARAAYLMDRLMVRFGLSAASRSSRCCRRSPARSRA